MRKNDLFLSKILNVTLTTSGMNKPALHKKCRFHRTIRNLYFLVANENTTKSLNLIGKPFNTNRDLVFKSIKSVSKDIETDDVIKLLYNKIKKNLNG
jgi:hypothetical protein